MTQAALLITRRGSPVRGFTFVELIVVIFIIALLIAMLLPAFERTRDVTRETICMSQLRQIAIGVINYAGSSDGYVPPHYSTRTGSPQYNGHWMNNATLIYPWHYRGSDFPAPGVSFGAGLTFPHYLTDARVFYCPDSYGRVNSWASVPDQYHAFNDPIQGNRGYANYGVPGTYYSSYVYPSSIDPLWDKRRSLGQTTNSNVNGYKAWGGSFLPAPYGGGSGSFHEQMISPHVSFIYTRLEENFRAAKPMVWDLTYGSWINHKLNAANVAYWDGRVLRYPYVRHDYNTYIWTSSGGVARGMTHRVAPYRLRLYGLGVLDAP